MCPVYRNYRRYGAGQPRWDPYVGATSLPLLRQESLPHLSRARHEGPPEGVLRHPARHHGEAPRPGVLFSDAHVRAGPPPLCNERFWQVEKRHRQVPESLRLTPSLLDVPKACGGGFLGAGDQAVQVERHPGLSDRVRPVQCPLARRPGRQAGVRDGEILHQDRSGHRVAEGPGSQIQAPDRPVLRHSGVPHGQRGREGPTKRTKEPTSAGRPSGRGPPETADPARGRPSRRNASGRQTKEKECLVEHVRRRRRSGGVETECEQPRVVHDDLPAAIRALRLHPGGPPGLRPGSAGQGGGEIQPVPVFGRAREEQSPSGQGEAVPSRRGGRPASRHPVPARPRRDRVPPVGIRGHGPGCGFLGRWGGREYRAGAKGRRAGGGGTGPGAFACPGLRRRLPGGRRAVGGEGGRPAGPGVPGCTAPPGWPDGAWRPAPLGGSGAAGGRSPSPAGHLAPIE